MPMGMCVVVAMNAPPVAVQNTLTRHARTVAASVRPSPTRATFPSRA
jgi:hypothetical protein